MREEKEKIKKDPENLFLFFLFSLLFYLGDNVIHSFLSIFHNEIHHSKIP